MNAPTAIALSLALATAGFLGGRSLNDGDKSTPDPEASGATSLAPVSALAARDLAPIRGAGWDAFIALEPGDLESAEWARLLADCRSDPFRAAAIVRRWARLDPAACWEGIVELGGGRPDPELAEIAIPVWTEADPEAALRAVAGAAIDRQKKGGMLGRVLESIFHADFASGLALLKEHHHLNPHLPDGVRPWMETDPEAVCKALADMRPVDNTRFTLSAAALAWYRVEPEAALGWMRGLDRIARGDVLDEIGEELEDKGDLDAIAALVVAETSMLARQQIGSHARDLLGEQDPALAARWIVDHYEARMAGGELSNLMRTSGREADPQIFVPFVEELPPGYGKMDAAEQVFAKWHKTEPTAALDWLATLDAFSLSQGANPTYQRLEPEVVRSWLETAPESPLADRVRRWLTRIDQGDTPPQAPVPR